MTLTTNGAGAIRDLPIVSGLQAGYDVGGTSTDVRFVQSETGTIIFEHSYPSADFASLDAVIVRSLFDAGVRPQSAGIVAAGGLKPDGTVKMAARTVDHWPIFDPADATRRLGIQIRVENDMVGACAGLRAGCTDFRELIPGVVLDGPRLVVTFSTGINHGFLASDGTIYKAESGHATWQPVTLIETRYLLFLRKRYQCEIISVEQAASGGQGFVNAFDFLVEEGHKFSIDPPRRALADRVRELRENERGIGQAIDQYALAADHFATAVWNLVGSILGQYLRNLILTTLPTGGIYLIGSVATGAAEYMISQTWFMSRLLPHGAMYNDLISQIPIMLVTDQTLSVRGALHLAP